MFFKLALKNVTKSIKDYTVYFLTMQRSQTVFLPAIISDFCVAGTKCRRVKSFMTARAEPTAKKARVNGTHTTKAEISESGTETTNML